MKLSRRSASVSDQTFSRMMRLGLSVLVVGALAFGVFYYQDQHVDAGPSMIERQTQAAEAAVRKAPNDIGARLALAAVYQSGKRQDDALSQYNVILKAAKGNQTALLGSGFILNAQGKSTAAAAVYHRVVAELSTGQFAGADPQLEQAHYYLGSIALTQGNGKLAITELSAALKINGQDSDSLYLMGVAQLKAGTPQLAVEALNQALSFVPTGWCEPYSQLALAYEKFQNAPKAAFAAGMAESCKNPGAAKTKLETLIKGPEAVNAMLAIAVMAETQGSKAEAVTWYQKVISMDAKNATATSALSRLGAGPTSSSTTQGPS